MPHGKREAYETAFARQIGASAARAFALGRHGLFALLQALHIGRGDAVGVCSYTCLSVIEAVLASGAHPVYLDVDDSLCIDPRQISARGPGALRAVILQHTFGVPGELDELLAACRTMGAHVIEDCAHALGCAWHGKPLGSFGAGAIYSSEWGKPFSTGQGGVLALPSDHLLAEVDAWIGRSSGPTRRLGEIMLAVERGLYPLLGFGRYSGYVRLACETVRRPLLAHGKAPKPEALSVPVMRMGERTAACGLNRLDQWPALQALRRNNTALIARRLRDLGQRAWPWSSAAEVTLLRYPVPTPEPERVIRTARRKRLDLSGWYRSPVHPLQGEALRAVGYEPGSCPHVEQMIPNLVYLPTGPTLDAARLEAMLDIIRDSRS
jgi:perosamine synthetase